MIVLVDLLWENSAQKVNMRKFCYLLFLPEILDSKA
jgi:hypothetical protein